MARDGKLDLDYAGAEAGSSWCVLASLASELSLLVDDARPPERGAQVSTPPRCSESPPRGRLRSALVRSTWACPQARAPDPAEPRIRPRATPVRAIRALVIGGLLPGGVSHTRAARCSDPPESSSLTPRRRRSARTALRPAGPASSRRRRAAARAWVRLPAARLVCLPPPPPPPGGERRPRAAPPGRGAKRPLRRHVHRIPPLSTRTRPRTVPRAPPGASHHLRRGDHTDSPPPTLWLATVPGWQNRGDEGRHASPPRTWPALLAPFSPSPGRSARSSRSIPAQTGLTTYAAALPVVRVSDAVAGLAPLGPGRRARLHAQPRARRLGLLAPLVGPRVVRRRLGGS